MVHVHHLWGLYQAMIEKQPHPEWEVLPRTGCKNILARVLLAKEGLTVANLRFGINATIDPHPASWDIDVVCISGSGYTSIEDETFEISAGQSIRWPAGKVHCLWTEETEMETLMMERHGG